MGENHGKNGPLTGFLILVTTIPVTFGSKYLKYSDYHGVSEAALLRLAQSWPWGSQTAAKKNWQSFPGEYGNA